MLIRLKNFRRRILLFPRKIDRVNLTFVKTFFLRRSVFLLRPESELVGLLARDAEVLGDVVAGLGHRMVAVLLDRFRVREAHADGGVVQLAFATEPALGL